MSKPKYKRVLLKLSGEAMLPHDSAYGVGLDAAGAIGGEIASALERGCQIGVVIGGGNIFRGASAASQGMERAAADAVGMLATVINSLALQEVLERQGVTAHVMTSIPMQGIAETFSRHHAIEYLEAGRVVIFAGGTGQPYFSTDTAAVLRALQVQANVILKATKVDGVFSDDPMKNPAATRYESLSYIEVLKQRLRVMDATAISMCMEHKLPLIVFNMFKEGNLLKAVEGRTIGTVVYE